jgi:hypothetical protein
MFQALGRLLFCSRFPPCSRAKCSDHNGSKSRIPLLIEHSIIPSVLQMLQIHDPQISDKPWSLSGGYPTQPLRNRIGIRSVIDIEAESNQEDTVNDIKHHKLNLFLKHSLFQFLDPGRLLKLGELDILQDSHTKLFIGNSMVVLPNCSGTEWLVQILVGDMEIIVAVGVVVW